MTESNGAGRDPAGDSEVRAGSKHLTRWVAQTLREQIMSGELSPGDKLPSQNALEGRFNVSTVTVRNAVEELEDEGLIAKRQGAHTQVHNREPTHRLVINLLHPALAGEAAQLPRIAGGLVREIHKVTSGSATQLPHLAREAANEIPKVAGERATPLPDVAGEAAAAAEPQGVAEPPVSFAPLERRHGRLRHESTGRQVPAAGHVAALLGLRDGDVVVERTFTLFYDDEPVLTSTSYLPPSLVADTADPTVPNVQVGQLALEGHPVTSVALRLRTRMPDPAEFEKLAMVKGTPVQVLTHGVIVETGQSAEPVRAAVEVVSRGDRVYVEIELDGR